MTARERLIYLPLGGAGEIGMNAYVYGYGEEGRERLILVDLGIAFPDMDTTPGVDIILPDVAWLAERADRLEGVFVTHAHEDHVGGVGHLHRMLGRPAIHARRFTANIARRKLAEQGGDEAAVKVARPFPEMIEAGPFRVGFLPVSHSIPEANALVIDTPAGRIVHSGDFKIDATPVLGEPFDEDLWREAARPGVRALVCDSTNVFNRHANRSEAAVKPDVTELIRGARGMVVATTFASNLARLRTLAEAAQDAGRSVVLLGRAMKRMTEAAMEEGIMPPLPGVVSVEDGAQVPRENLLLMVTGSQGERRAASAQLSRGRYMGFEIQEGDTFLFSSKTIPGNEREVAYIMNALSEKGVDIVTGDDGEGLYHVSGHANRPDLERVHAIVDPQVVIPNHGEHRHLREHAKLARAAGRGAAVVPNGTVIDLAGNQPQVVEHVETGRTYLDGTAMVGQFDGVVRDRIRMALHGHVVVAVMVDEGDEVMEDTWVDLRGLPETSPSGETLQGEMERVLSEALGRAPRKVTDDDDKLEELVRRTVRMVASQEIGKKPEVSVLITRLVAD